MLKSDDPQLEANQMIESNVPLDDMMQSILRSAVDGGVGEIHIERQRRDAPVRREIKGLPKSFVLSNPFVFWEDTGVFVFFRGQSGLEKQLELPDFMAKPLLARIRELSGAQVSEQHDFPEGRLQFAHGSHRCVWQVLIGPNEWGEKAVLRQTSM